MLKFLFISFPIFFGYLVNGQQFLTLSENKEGIDYRAITDYQTGYLFSLYNQKIDNSNEVINGREYYPYYYRSEVKPILFSEKKKSGSLAMNGRKYTDLALEYDTYLDEVIYTDNTKFYQNKALTIALNSEQVEGFNLYFENDSLIFRHFRSINGSKFNLPGGYYEVVYDGESKYIIKHQSSVTKEKSLDVYLYSSSSYVSVGEKFSRLRSRKEFIKLFGDRSGDIKKFMHANNVQIRRGEKNKIASVLKYYDSLIMSGK